MNEYRAQWLQANGTRKSWVMVALSYAAVVAIIEQGGGTVISIHKVWHHDL